MDYAVSGKLDCIEATYTDRPADVDRIPELKLVMDPPHSRQLLASDVLSFRLLIDSYLFILLKLEHPRHKSERQTKHLPFLRFLSLLLWLFRRWLLWLLVFSLLPFCCCCWCLRPDLPAPIPVPPLLDPPLALALNPPLLLLFRLFSPTFLPLFRPPVPFLRSSLFLRVPFRPECLPLGISVALAVPAMSSLPEPRWPERTKFLAGLTVTLLAGISGSSAKSTMGLLVSID